MLRKERRRGERKEEREKRPESLLKHKKNMEPLEDNSE